jgi:carbonic anhydrase
MWYRRAAAAAVLLTAMTTTVSAQSAPGTPQDPLDRLKAGNERFVRDAAAPMPIDTDRRRALVGGQTPFAIVMSCADSRVPPEIVFNTGLGDVFVVRTAGQVVDRTILGSVEYAAEHLKVPLLVVMGHDSCGAVTAAIGAKNGAPSMGPNMDALINEIKPAFDRMSATADLEHLHEAILANVEEVVNDMLSRSEIIKHLVDRGELSVVGAYYELDTGRVRFSQPVKTAVAASPAAPAPADHR